MYFLEVALNFAVSFLRTVTLGGKLLKIVVPALNVLFGKQDRCGNWCMTMMLNPFVNIIYRQICLKNFLIVDIEAHKLQYILAWNRQNL
jgi:hypothetical protein